MRSQPTLVFAARWQGSRCSRVAAWKKLMRRNDARAAARAGTTWWLGLTKIERALDSAPDEL